MEDNRTIPFTVQDLQSLQDYMDMEYNTFIINDTKRSIKVSEIWNDLSPNTKEKLLKNSAHLCSKQILPEFNLRFNQWYQEMIQVDVDRAFIASRINTFIKEIAIKKQLPQIVASPAFMSKITGAVNNNLVHQFESLKRKFPPDNPLTVREILGDNIRDHVARLYEVALDLPRPTLHQLLQMHDGTESNDESSTHSYYEEEDEDDDDDNDNDEQEDMMNVGEGNNIAEEEPPQEDPMDEINEDALNAVDIAEEEPPQEDPMDEINEDALNAVVRDVRTMEDLMIQFPSLSISEDAEDNFDAFNLFQW
jgi:hypothetical protein